jgi:hypothetical protein
MVLAIILISWAVVSVLTAVCFAAIGRGAFREDEALGYTAQEGRAASEDRAGPHDGAGVTDDVVSKEAVTKESVTSQVTPNVAVANEVVMHSASR